MKWPPGVVGVVICGRDRDGGSRRRGRGFVLRASDDVLIFISCY